MKRWKKNNAYIIMWQNQHWVEYTILSRLWSDFLIMEGLHIAIFVYIMNKTMHANLRNAQIKIHTSDLQTFYRDFKWKQFSQFFGRKSERLCKVV